MKLYADSADVEVVRSLLIDRLITGVTTNPTILHSHGYGSVDHARLYRTFDEAGAAEIFFQATGDSRDAMRRSADSILELGPSAIVKVPATSLGFRVAAALTREGAPILVTAVYSLAQAVAAASIGARYIAPYFGRLSDAGHDALATLANMNTVVADSQTRVLVASVRTPHAAADLALAGIRHITAHPVVLHAMLEDPASDSATVEFERVSST